MAYSDRSNFWSRIRIRKSIQLNVISIDSTKFFNEITEKINAGDTDGAIQICNEEKGPVASIFMLGCQKCIEVLTM